MSSIKRLMEEHPIETHTSPQGKAQRLNEMKQSPYWNFWKVVFAGWLIRYPGKFFKAIMWMILIPLLGVGYILSTPQREQPSETLNNPTIDNYINSYEKNVFDLLTR